MGPTTIDRSISVYPNKDTKNMNFLIEDSRRIQGQEEDAGDVHKDQNNVEGTEEKDVKEPEDIDEGTIGMTQDIGDTGDIKAVQCVEEAEDFGDAEKFQEDAEMIKNAKQEEHGEEKIEDAGRGIKEDEEDEEGDEEEDGDEEKDVKEDAKENLRGRDQVFTEEEFGGIKERHNKRSLSRTIIDENTVNKGKNLHVRHSNLARITDENNTASEIRKFQNTETTVADFRRERPSMEEAQMEPVQNVLSLSENTAIQSTPAREDIKRILSQIASSALHRPRRTALGTRNFMAYVLNPRGIHIDTDGIKTESAFEHFKSVEPPGESNVYNHYRKLTGSRSSTVWINPTTETIRAIHENYSEMHHSVPNAPCEPEWVDDAVKFLLKSEPRRELQPKPSNTPEWLPVRMREESFRPQEGGAWEIPPVVHKDMPVDPTFNFNVHPDCSYWIWSGGLRPEINGKLTSLASVRFRRSLCPYLTIEVKRDNKQNSKGRQQIAAAASTALYNRWRLKESYLRASGMPLSRERFSEVRHYGLLLAGVRYEIWCLRPHNIADTSCYSTNSWTGCNMQKIHSGDLDTNAGIMDYINWINEIHCWGNTRHSVGCARDIENRLLPKGKALANDLAPLALVKKDNLRA